MKFTWMPAGPAVAAAIAALHPTLAGAQSLALSPADAHIALTTYSFGLFPRTGEFQAFAGRLDVDTDKPGRCAVTLTVKAASLHMSGPGGSLATAIALGPDLLDATQYPDIQFDGACGPAGPAGALTMHGVRNPLSLAQSWAGDTITATGKILRKTFGMRGLPGLIGGRVDFAMRITIPAAVAALLPR